ncbi:keratin, type I cytoskeletal 47 kDa-like [Gastrophryne carolinensis]
MTFSSRSISQSGRFSGASSGPSIHRARSVAGSPASIRMSSASVNMAAPSFRSGFSVQEAGGFAANGKETMQNLNDRLASYLERVRSLEQANSELEIKIREFYDKQSTVKAFDPSGYYDTINKLRSQIQAATIDNTRIILQIDNAKLAADDFKMKFESEMAIRQGVDSDIIGLRKALDELTINRSDLELEIEGLKEELIFLKRNHEEELALAKSQTGGNVSVELDSAPAVDLSKVLAEVRQQYELMVEKNRQEVETWYRAQSETLSKEVAVSQQSFQTSKTEITELRRTSQSLELELQSLLNMKRALEGTLAETEAQYGVELSKLQGLISNIELDLQQVRSDSEHHSLEYKRLLDAKTRLEQEIATYRRLLDGEDFSFSSVQQVESSEKNVKIVSKEESQRSSTKTIKVKTVVEEVVDGKVVSTSVKEVDQNSGFSIQEAGSFGGNGKETMHNLNDRLASYLERVRSLEQTNNELENKIRVFYEEQSAIKPFDPSGYHDTIKKLRSQIQEATIDNTRIILQIDNSKLAADDFNMKFESEMAFHQGVESDIIGLRKALDELTIKRSNLELEFERLSEELIFLKRNHEEELALAKSQAGRNVSVELDSAPAVDLSKVLAEVRQQYELMVEKNRQEAETWYRTQSENLSKEVTVYQQSFQSSKTEVTELRRTLQSLELDLQNLLNMKHALEGTLAETEARYGVELSKHQSLISHIELDLQQVRSDSEHHAMEYKRLLDVKTKLEQEIATYRRLLEGEDFNFSSVQKVEHSEKNVKIISKEESQRSSTKTIKVRTIVEEVVDGKVVSTSVKQEDQTTSG